MIKNNVAAIRLELGMTQIELARKAKISRVAVSAIENGTIPKGETMIKISKALGRPVEEVFEENVNQN